MGILLPDNNDFQRHHPKAEIAQFAIENDEMGTPARIKDIILENCVTPDQVYKSTNQIIELPTRQKIRIKIELKTIAVQGFDYEIAETTVEPLDEKIYHTSIYLGGYSINTPYYFNEFMPFAALGIRQVHINLLGAGGSGFATGNLSPYPQKNKPTLGKLNAYREIATKQIQDLLTQYQKPDQTVSLNGMSLGAATILETLHDLNQTPSEINFDAPLPSNRLPFGLGIRLAKIAGIGITNGYPQVLLCKPGELSQDAIYKMMLANPLLPNEVRKEVADSCFKAVGSFLEISAHLRPDPISSIANFSEEHSRIVSIPFTYYTRTNDGTVGYKAIKEQIARHRAKGIEITHHTIDHGTASNQHILAPTLWGLQETLGRYGN